MLGSVSSEKINELRDAQTTVPSLIKVNAGFNMAFSG